MPQRWAWWPRCPSSCTLVNGARSPSRRSRNENAAQGSVSASALVRGLGGRGALRSAERERSHSLRHRRNRLPHSRVCAARALPPRHLRSDLPKRPCNSSHSRTRPHCDRPRISPRTIRPRHSYRRRGKRIRANSGRSWPSDAPPTPFRRLAATFERTKRHVARQSGARATPRYRSCPLADTAGR
jgi:hypothetical protein